MPRAIASIGVPLGTLVYSRLSKRVAAARLLLAEFALLSLGFALMGRSGSVPALGGVIVALGVSRRRSPAHG